MRKPHIGGNVRNSKEKSCEPRNASLVQLRRHMHGHLRMRRQPSTRKSLTREKNSFRRQSRHIACVQSFGEILALWVLAGEKVHGSSGHAAITKKACLT